MSETPFPLSHRFLLGRARHALADRELHILEAAITQVERLPDDAVILKRGVIADRSTLLVEGFIARVIPEGERRHIIALQVPGDFVDLHAFALKRLDHDIVAVGPVRVGYVAHDKLEWIMANEPHLARILWFSTLLDAATHRAWILKLEGLHVDGRLAHLFCEIWQRLEMVGLADPKGFALPLTQVELADTCGTTPVHLNRIIRQFRESGILELTRGRVTVTDRAALASIGNFDGTYLYGDGDLHLLEELRKQ